MNVGTAPGDKPGLKWTSKYAAMGANVFNKPAIIDGSRRRSASEDH